MGNLRKSMFLVAIIAAMLVSQFGCGSKKTIQSVGGTRITFRVDTSKLPDEATVDSVSKMLRKRVEARGTHGSDVRIEKENNIVVDLPGVKTPDEYIKYLMATGRLEFYYLIDVRTNRNIQARYDVKFVNNNTTFTDLVNNEIIPNGDIMTKVVGEQTPILTSADIKLGSCKPETDENGSQVSMTLSNHGAQKLAEFTRTHVGEVLAVFYNGRITCAPTIKTALTNKQISITTQSVKDANDIAYALDAGTAPEALTVLQKQVFTSDR